MMDDELQVIARTYLDVQATRTGAKHRMDKLIKTALINGGAAKEEIIAKTTGKGQIHNIVVTDKELEEEIKERVQATSGYKILERNAKELERREKQLLKEAEELFEDSMLWEWCKRTNGLGPVAALTFTGFINLHHATTAGKACAFAGIYPGARFEAGVQGNFSKAIKGRYYLVGKNVIMAKDPYYTAIYRAKKEYYRNRPDILIARDPHFQISYKECGHSLLVPLETDMVQTIDTVQSGRDANTVLQTFKVAGSSGSVGTCGRCNKIGPVTVTKSAGKKGWKGWTDRMAYRFLVKILISHAWELMRKEAGQEIYPHRFYMPPKPADEKMQKKTIEAFVKSLARFLEDTKADMLAKGMIKKSSFGTINVPDEDGDIDTEIAAIQE